MKANSRAVLFLDIPLAVIITMVSFMTAGFATWSAGDGGWNPQNGDHNGPPWASGGPTTDGPFVSWTVAPFLLLLLGGIVIRRLHPRVAFVLTVVGAGGYLALGHPLGVVLLGPVLTLLAMATLLPLRRWFLLTLLLVPMIHAEFWDLPYAGLTSPDAYIALFFLLLLMGLPILVGVLRRSHLENQQLERAQEVRRSTYEERLRIAREVHDVVGHSLSVISMQAGVALHVLQKRPDQVEASLEAIRSTSKDALEELRGTLAVFRGPEADEQRAPQPGLARLDELMSPLRAAGTEVELRVESGEDGALPRVPASVDHAAYRIIQEALTNVVRHSGGAGAIVRISHDDALLIIEVSDDGPPVREAGIVPGNGISGMRERAMAVGGHLVIEAHQGRVSVRAELPIAGERA